MGYDKIINYMEINSLSEHYGKAGNWVDLYFSIYLNRGCKDNKGYYIKVSKYEQRIRLTKRKVYTQIVKSKSFYLLEQLPLKEILSYIAFFYGTCQIYILYSHNSLGP